MPKNIVVCCDGTGNEFGRNNTNVVDLFNVIEKNISFIFKNVLSKIFVGTKTTSP